MSCPKVDVGDLLMVDMEKVLECDMNPYVPFWREADRIGNIALVCKLHYDKEGKPYKNVAYVSWIKPIRITLSGTEYESPAGTCKMLELDYLKVIKGYNLDVEKVP